MSTLIQVPVPGTASTIAATSDGESIALRPACDALGIDYSGQRQRLERQAWAVMCVTPTTGSDGKTYEMLTLDRQTFTMWLATLTASRIKNESARETLVAFQKEAASALDRYFHQGGAINGAGPSTERDIVQQALAIVHRDLEAANHRIAALEPRARYVETYVADEDLRILRNVAKSLDIQESALRKALQDHHWIYREESSRWSEKRQEKVIQYRYSPYAEFRPYFRPVPNHEAPRFKGEVDHTLKVTPAGAVAIERAARRWGLIPSTELEAAA